ncbi:MAG: hypothetical protein ACK4RV_10260 [Caulobacter sp.]
MSNVISMGGDRIVGADFRVEPDAVLAAPAGKLRDVVVIGYEPDGSLYVAASGGAAESLWLLEMAKRFLLEGGE